MKIVSVNSVYYGSTGKIMLQISETARKAGHEAYVCYPKGRHNPEMIENAIPVGGRFSEDFHLIMDRLTGLNGCFSRVATRRLISRLKKIKPDIVHLHNLHNCYINLGLLFNYIKKNQIRVVWTLHDCWAFTGHCPNFDMEGCSKWKSGCFHCPQYRFYPQSYVDRSRSTYQRKKKYFTGVENLTIVTPSEWLAGLVKQSFLKEYPVKVINNGIDLSIFKPTESDFRKRYHCEDKIILLGVAFGWGVRKGLDVFVRLAEDLDDRFQIVLVGTSEQVDQRLPENIISIHKTRDQNELAKIYSVADLLVNPTREEVLGLVNIESLACGTPIVMFKTGGSPESLDETCGSVVEKEDYAALKKEILRIVEERPFLEADCVNRAKLYDMQDKFKKYVELYEESI